MRFETDSEEIARCPVHNEYYRRWPECWNTLVAPTEAEDTLIIPTVHRGAERGAFGPEERRLLGLLAPHLTSAVQWRGLLRSEMASAEGLAAAFDALPEPVLLLDMNGVLRFANLAGRQVLASRDGLEVRRGVLAARERKAKRALDKRISEALRVASGEATQALHDLAMRRGEGSGAYIASFTPMPHPNPACAGVVIRLRAADAVAEPSLEVLRAALSLTEAEARLALALARGLTTAEHAAGSGTSEHTARTHLRNLREKLGARRQADVVRLVLALGR